MSFDNDHDEHDDVEIIKESSIIPEPKDNIKPSEPEKSDIPVDSSRDEEVNEMASSEIKHSHMKKDTVPLAKNSKVKKINAFLSKHKTTPVQRKIWLGILAILLLATFIFALHRLGYNQGFEEGKKQNKVPSRLIDRSSSSSSKVVSGKVLSVSVESIEIELTSGDKKTIKISDSTKITKKTAEIKAQDIKKDQKVQVFVSDKENPSVATRVVVRD